MPRGYRTGTITKEEAVKKFNEYYDKRGKTENARFKAKLMDMMYQKKSKFLLKPGEPGSIKYMLEEGPRTFDMEGVDYFPEGELFVLERPGKEPYIGVSRGATSGKSTTDDDEAYGPRINRLKQENPELYKKYFSKKYKEWQSSKKGVNLVDIYWKKFKENKDESVKEDSYVRKNLKNNNKTKTKTFSSKESISVTYDNKKYFISKDLNIYELKNNNHVFISSIKDVDNDFKKYLIQNEFIVSIGNTFVVLYDDSMKVYFKVTGLSETFYFNTSLEVFNSKNVKVASSLESLYDKYGIYSEDINLIKPDNKNKIEDDSSSSSESEDDDKKNNKKSKDKELTELNNKIDKLNSPSKSISKQDKTKIVEQLNKKGVKKIRGMNVKTIVDKLK